MLLGAVLGLFSAYLLQSRSAPPLEPWHRPVGGADFRVRDPQTFDAYLAKEQALFDRLERAVRRREVGESARVFDRYNPVSPSNPANHPRNWNRTFELEAPQPRGGALLIHGLSDSPYSTRAIGQVLNRRGLHVLGLRVPGHGTIPGALTATEWQDWSAAVRVAARELATRVGPDRPLVLVGYSNGAALALDYTLTAIEDSDDPVPSQLVFLSPALSVKSVAGLARMRRCMAMLPGLGRLAWTSNRPEFDPFKYSSFPVRAAEEIYALTSRLDSRIGRLHERGPIETLPDVVVFQSVVDSTIPPAGVVDRLLSKLAPGRAELVLFDVNRNAPEGLFRNTSYDVFLQSLVDDPGLAFGLTVVTNVSPESREVRVRRREAGESGWSETDLGLAWPPMVYSLSHVALPFPPDDPVYGSGEGTTDETVLNIGGVAARGERGLLALPTDLLMRLRYNPFFAYLERRLVEEVEPAAR
jgi:pimeloyl-ACP methyl ester carboxylesterase